MRIFNESVKGYWMEGREPSIIGCDLYNGRLSGDKAVTLTANACSSSNHAGPSVIVLNDQGGSVMDVSDKAGCSQAQEHGHPPVICHVAAFMGGQGSKARGIAYSESVSPTIKSVMSGGNTIPDVVYEKRLAGVKENDR